MEINLLTLSVGNSRLAIGTFVDGELQQPVAHIPHAQRADWADAIRHAWEPIATRQSPAIVGASVNPPLIEPLEHVIAAVTGLYIEWVGPDIDLPIKVRSKTPEQIGVDRVLNVAAAHEQIEKACAVVDAGTAITVDCCNDAGEFLGGSISPGVAMQLDALHERTAKLPRVQFARPNGAFGENTEQAILHGILNGARGLVREVVEGFATQLGQWPDVIATGGDASILFEGWDVINAVAPDLTLYGIALAYTNHYIKHES